MVFEVKHGLRTGSTRIRSANEQGAKTTKLSAIHVLANMYQRIPANVLSSMESKQVQNFAILQNDGFGVHEHCPTHDCSPNARWIPKAVPGGGLRSCLRQVEEENASNPNLEKIKIHFCDGYVVTLSRTRMSDPSSLSFSSEYDPSAQFQKATAAKSAESRAKLVEKLRFLTDDRGRPLRPRTASQRGSSRPVSPLGVPKPPAPGRAGFCFTPVGMLSFAMRPNDTVTGVRPDLRNTNPQAVHYRPRPLLRPLTPSVQEHATGLILDGSQPIDYRNSVRRNRGESAH
jgi:hypothetical protein